MLLSDKSIENTEEDQDDDDETDFFYQDKITKFSKEEWEILSGQS